MLKDKNSATSFTSREVDECCRMVFAPAAVNSCAPSENDMVFRSRVAHPSKRTHEYRFGHVKPKPPMLDLSQPGRLRTGNVLALCGISHSTLYKRIQDGSFPVPDGKDGGRNYWNTRTINEYLSK